MVSLRLHMAPIDKHPTFHLRHRRRSSSTADTQAAGIAARRPRRLSASATRRSPAGLFERALDCPQLLVAVVIVVVFL